MKKLLLIAIFAVLEKVREMDGHEYKLQNYFDAGEWVRRDGEIAPGSDPNVARIRRAFGRGLRM